MFDENLTQTGTNQPDDCILITTIPKVKHNCYFFCVFSKKSRQTHTQGETFGALGGRTAKGNRRTSVFDDGSSLPPAANARALDPSRDYRPEQ
jgi:hypothetical protein